jgi:adenine phosphoribosyltransferase
MFMDYKKYIADVKDFPIEGILFRDVTPLIQDGEAFDSVCNDFAEFAKEVDADIIVGPEARGFIFGCPVACKLKKGFVPIRKPNKLPRETVSMSYDLEYGSNVLSIHKDSIKPGQKVVLVDDLIATGGTIEAAAKLVEQLGGEVVKIIFLMELAGLEGRKKLAKYDVGSVICYEGK